MKKIQDAAAIFFMVCVVIFAGISILGIWDVFIEDVIAKSLWTIGVLAFAGGVVLVVARFMDSKEGDALMALQVNPIFKLIRHTTLWSLIVLAAILTLIGIMSIWEVLSKEVIGKSLSSIGVLAFASFIIVFTSLVREKHKFLQTGQGQSEQKKSSLAAPLLWVLFFIFIVPILISFLSDIL